jgi:hypothetical protein
MILRKIFLCAAIALALILTLAPRAFAQDPNRLAALKISVWPEYDKPTVLVIVDGTLADKTNLPRAITILIPSKAELLVATYANPDGTSFAPEQATTSKDLGDGWTSITFTINTPSFRVEYYHDALIGAADKTIDFAHKLSAPADAITVEIQQPLRASNFATTPALSATRTDSDGFKYFSGQYQNVAAGQTLKIQVKYTKTDPHPSFVATPTANTPGSSAPANVASDSFWQNAFLLTAAVALGLVAVFGFLMLQKRQAQTHTAPRHTARKSQAARRAQSRASASSAFCTQCGRALGAEDNFCPRCGAKRRTV